MEWDQNVIIVSIGNNFTHFDSQFCVRIEEKHFSKDLKEQPKYGQKCNVCNNRDYYKNYQTIYLFSFQCGMTIEINL